MVEKLILVDDKFNAKIAPKAVSCQNINSINPSIFYPFLYSRMGRRGQLEPIPAAKWQEAGDTLDRPSAYRRANTKTDHRSHLWSI